MTRFLCCLLILCAANATTAATILWDDSHDADDDELTGNSSSFAAAMTTAGYTLFELNGSPGAITPAALTGMNAVFIWDNELALTANEIVTLHGYVAAGGGLFVAGDGGTNFAGD